MVYENAKIEVILADEDISMKLEISEEGDGDGGINWGEDW